MISPVFRYQEFQDEMDSLEKNWNCFTGMLQNETLPEHLKNFVMAKIQRDHQLKLQEDVQSMIWGFRITFLKQLLENSGVGEKLRTTIGSVVQSILAVLKKFHLPVDVPS